MTRTNRKGRSLAEVMSSIEEDERVSPPAETDAATAPRLSGPVIVPVNMLVTPEDRHRLRQLSLDTGLSLQKLGHEAWNLLLARRGLPPLTGVSANVPSGRKRS